MANQNSPENIFRREIENAMAPLVEVEQHLRIAQTKLGQWARTDLEADILREMIKARRKAASALEQLAAIHPNGRKEK